MLAVVHAPAVLCIHWYGFIITGTWIACYNISVNQLQLRQTERSMSVLTPLHLTLIKDILKLSVSEYAQVR